MPHISFKIFVNDTNGNQIIQKEGGEEAIKKILSIEYRGYTSTVRKKGEPDNEIYNGSYRFSPAISYTDDGKPKVIRFGSFAPEMNYKDETFTLIWSDGTKDIVKLNTYVSEKNDIYNYTATINGLSLEWEDPYTPIIRKTIK